MSAFDALNLLDLRRQLPYRGPPLPAFVSSPDYVTLHYSGIDYPDRSHAGEIKTLANEARYHLAKNWGTKESPAWSDGLQYHVTVLSDGTGIYCVDRTRQRWH